MKIKAFIVAIGIFFTLSCTDTDGAKQVLEYNNYKPIEIGGYGFFKGSKDDHFVTKFKAIAPNGIDTVTGVVTRGMCKGSTIRID